ncbi:MAG TPA: class I SAM-dependent methyltransferase [Planctomycetes bacterium]|nr:class I SAM-dependent methyltransferase [Planctomycetota bacterium]
MKISLKSTLWYLARPGIYAEYLKKVLLAVKKRVMKPVGSGQWCRSKAMSMDDLMLKLVGGVGACPVENLSESTNGLLLYNLAEHLQATRIIETGVARGESTRCFLTSLKNRNGKLISTDIPRPDLWVDTGCLVPDDLAEYWQLIEQPDRKALPKALELMPKIDMCYYDSDKSYGGRMFAYPLLWNALRRGGIFVSDDIDDNFAFRDFCKNLGLQPFIAKTAARFVGVIRK